MAWFAEGISPAAHKKLSIRHPSEKSNRRIGGCVATAQSKMTVAPRHELFDNANDGNPTSLTHFVLFMSEFVSILFGDTERIRAVCKGAPVTDERKESYGHQSAR